MNNFMEKVLCGPRFCWVGLIYSLAARSWATKVGRRRAQKFIKDWLMRECTNMDQPKEQQILYKLYDPYMVSDRNFTIVHSLLYSVPSSAVL